MWIQVIKEISVAEIRESEETPGRRCWSLSERHPGSGGGHARTLGSFETEAAGGAEEGRIFRRYHLLTGCRSSWQVVELAFFSSGSFSSPALPRTIGQRSRPEHTNLKTLPWSLSARFLAFNSLTCIFILLASRELLNYTERDLTDAQVRVKSELI